MRIGEPSSWVDLLHRLSPLLPASTFNQLRETPTLEGLPAQEEPPLAEALVQAIKDLDALHHRLTTFLPRYLLDLAPSPGQPHGELLHGSFIFADVTGFTALTGELSKRGTAGREEMNRLMRNLFGALLDPLLTSGGDLLIFAGDAVLAWFPAHSEGQDAAWATRTALRLVRAIEPFSHLETPYGTFSLTMSAGVERGRAFAAVVGTRRRMEFLVSGGPVQGATAAEGKAEPGQVFAGPHIRPYLSDRVFRLRGGVVEGLVHGELDDYETVPPARRRSRLSAIFSRRVPDLVADVRQALAQVEALIPFIPPDLFKQIARQEDIRQHPPVAIQFVNLLGLEDLALGPAGPQQAATLFQRYFVQAQEIVADRAGVISQVDPYARGFTLLNPFGAPTHHEGVPRLAASAALELARLLDRINHAFELNPPLTQRVGMTYDRIFTGEIGYRHRCEYVIAGPAVNLAARLMSKAASSQIVLDPSAWQAIAEDFQAESLAPIPLKGIPEPVPRYDLRGLRQGSGQYLADYPLTGRHEELATLEERIDRAIDGKGGALALIGEAGVGKSRLATAAAAVARRRGLCVLNTRCQPFAQTTPYHPWTDLVGQWFALDGSMEPAARREQLKASLASLDLASCFPAFADLLGLPPVQPSSPPAPGREVPTGGGLFAALQDQTRPEEEENEPSPSPQRGQELADLLTERIAQAETRRKAKREEDKRSIWTLLHERTSIPHALCLALRRQAQAQPTLLIVEDVHWMDPASQDALEELLSQISDLPLFLLVTARPDVHWVGDRLALAPLPPAEGERLAALALQATGIEARLAGWLHERAAGNPLFILTYCRALRDADAVTVDAVSDQARWGGPPPPLPVSLQELLLAQIDRLDTTTRETIRRGAVIGNAFPDWLLADLCTGVYSSDQLGEALDRASRRTVITPPPPGPTFTFSSSSLHNAIYTTLSHASRQTWHEKIGDRLADADEPTRYERLEQIARHYHLSGNRLKAAHYTRLAGDKARTRQADQIALDLYQQTLAVVAEDGEKGASIRLEHQWAREGIGDVYILLGQIAEATGAYQAALTEAASQDESRLRGKLVLLAPLAGWPDPDVEAALQALAPSTPLRPWLGAAWCWMHAGRGETEAAIGVARAQLAQSVGEPVESLLRDGLESLTAGQPLEPYESLVTLFARTCLRVPPGGVT